MRRANSRALTGVRSGAVDQAFVPGFVRASVSAFPLARTKPGMNAVAPWVDDKTNEEGRRMPAFFV